MPAPERDLSELEKRIRYSFQNPEILRTALRHKSALEGKAGACNDRLEWLGDAVIGLFIADYLFQNYDRPPELALPYEGEMGKRRVSGVSGPENRS